VTIQLPVNGSGTVVDTVTVSAKDRQLFVVADPTTAAAMGAVINSAPAGTEYAQVVRVAGSVAVTGTFWQATQPVSGTFWQATQPVSGTFWQATQPVSGTVTANAGTGPFPISATQSAQTHAGTETTSLVRMIQTDMTASGTGTTAGASTITLTNVSGLTTLSVQVTGTWTQTTAANLPRVEGTVDGSTWIPNLIGSQRPGGSNVSAFTSGLAGVWMFDIGAWTSVRVNVPAALTTGTATFTLRASAGLPPDLELTTGQGKVVLYNGFSIATATSTTVLAAAGAGLKTKIFSLILVANGAQNVTLGGLNVLTPTGAAGTAPGSLNLAANAGFTMVGQPSAHLMETTANTAFTLTTSAATQTSGVVGYFVEA
jgi:hypothetical protein